MTVPLAPQPRQLVSGPPGFITISDIHVIPAETEFTLTCRTDQVCWLAVDWERTNPPADPGQLPFTGTLSGAGPQLYHVLTAPSVFAPGQEIFWTIRKDDNDNTNLELRPQLSQGYVILIGKRHQLGLDVPVRFYNFGDTPPPPPGGDEGDWNTYIWAQYNPSGTPFQRAALGRADINGTDGTRTIPVARCYARGPGAGGATISVQLDAMVPDLAQAIQQVPALYATNVFSVYVQGVLRERFAYAVPQPGHYEAAQALLRAVADSQLIRIAPLESNDKDNPPFAMGANYWLESLPQTPLVVI